MAEQFTKKGIECYCPQNRIDSKWGDRKKNLSQPLFSSYVFVHLPESHHNEVKLVRGVVDFVYWIGKPAVINTEEIDIIKNFLFNYPSVTLEKISVSYNESAQVINEPFINRKGNLVEVKNTSVKAILPSLGQMLVSSGNLKDNTDSTIHSDILRMTV